MVRHDSDNEADVTLDDDSAIGLGDADEKENGQIDYALDVYSPSEQVVPAPT